VTTPFSNGVASLVLTGVGSGNMGTRYRVIASNGIDPAAVSDSAGFTGAGNAPTVTTPAARGVAPGGSTTFTVTVTGDPTPSVRWQSLSTNSGALWTNMVDGTGVAGTTTTSLVLSGVSSTRNGYRYRAVATNGTDPPAVSGGALLTVS